MAQSAGRGRVVGDYVVGRQLGYGSYSVVWHARHRVHGTEVAIKEIATVRLTKNLQESLKSEIYILKRINHPNIIRLLDIIEVPGKIHIVLEYCRGGDLSMYIQRHGRVPEETAKHFMQQLATGLQILRDNNLIHRDLKPQNLLLTAADDRSLLKIADFGFARSLQPRNLAETLCGSPLYMAPEIMQLQKYDAKADLWSVGAILFQLVTGKTPFTGTCQLQLLENILSSIELQFPPESKDISSECKDLCQKLLRRNPVERLTFEEFFNHSFVSKKPQKMERTSSSKLPRAVDYCPSSEFEPTKRTEESSQDDCFPFILDEDFSGSGASPSASKRKSPIDMVGGFNLKKESVAKEVESNNTFGVNLPSRYSSTAPAERGSFRLDMSRPSEATFNDPLSSKDQQRPVTGSFEVIEGDYVLVSGMDVSSSSINGSKPNHLPSKLQSPSPAPANVMPPSTAPVPITRATNISTYRVGSLESHDSAPGTSLESMDMGDVLERPSTHSITRIKSLQQCASAIKELVNDKIESAKHLEAFSIQLVILAIWKQALNICHTQAASDMEGSPSQGPARLKCNADGQHASSDSGDCADMVDNLVGPEDVSPQIEEEFLREVEHAEQLAHLMEPGSTEIPDAMETIFQSALNMGRRGGVDELMGNTETAAALYTKAVQLLVFLLAEAPSLIQNPPFSLTNTDRFRLRRYIEILKSRQGHLRSLENMARQVEG